MTMSLFVGFAKYMLSLFQNFVVGCIMLSSQSVVMNSYGPTFTFTFTFIFFTLHLLHILACQLIRIACY